MRRLGLHLFTVCWVACAAFCGVAAVALLFQRAQFGHSLWLKPDGLTPWVADEVPYRWPVEGWETRPVLGFRAGVFWIGGTQAGRGNVLLRYRYVVVPYGSCGGVTVIALVGAAVGVHKRRRRVAHSASGPPI